MSLHPGVYRNGARFEREQNREIYLAYIHVEDDWGELRYYWQTVNAELGAVFSRTENGSWDYSDMVG